MSKMHKTFVYFIVVFYFTIAQKQLEAQKVESNQRCWTDNDCKANSFCFGNDVNKQGICKCFIDYVINPNVSLYECLKPAKLEDACKTDLQCSHTAGSMAFCNKYDICECNDVSHSYTNGVCYKNTNIDEFCDCDAECKLDDGRFAHCVKGRCHCPINERPTLDKRHCIGFKNLGDSCTTDEDCSLIPNAHCEVVCKCSNDYVNSRDGKRCLKAATKFDEPCVENDQCSKFLRGAICELNRCTCPAGFHSYGTKCFESKRPGDRCFTVEECIFNPKLKDHVICDGKCKCVHGGIIIEFGCVLPNNANTLNSLNMFLFFGYVFVSFKIIY